MINIKDLCQGLIDEGIIKDEFITNGKPNSACLSKVMSAFYEMKEQYDENVKPVKLSSLLESSNSDPVLHFTDNIDIGSMSFYYVPDVKRLCYEYPGRAGGMVSGYLQDKDKHALKALLNKY